MPVIYILRKTPNTKHQMLVSHDIFEFITNELIRFWRHGNSLLTYRFDIKNEIASNTKRIGKTYYEVGLE